MTHDPADALREPVRCDALAAVINQAEADLASAHEEICKLQGLDPKTHTWPEWSPQANTLRWFAVLREKFAIEPPDRQIAIPIDDPKQVAQWNARAALASPAPAGGEVLIKRIEDALVGPSVMEQFDDKLGITTGEREHIFRMAALLREAATLLESLSAEKGRLEAAARLRPMSDAPKNRTPVLLQVKASLPRDDLRRWEGLQFVGHHSGNWDDGFDPGWNMSAPVGHGGFPDEWFDGWRPLIARTALTPKE